MVAKVDVLDPAPAPRHGPPARPRDRPGDRRLRARAGERLPHPRLLLRRRALDGRAEFRPARSAPSPACSPSSPTSARSPASCSRSASRWSSSGLNWTWVVVVLAIFIIGQFVEGYILPPKLVGDRVGLHPVWLMFALFAFGYLFGFVGLLLAVPLAAAVGVLVRFALKQYLSSSLYRREAAPERLMRSRTGAAARPRPAARGELPARRFPAVGRRMRPRSLSSTPGRAGRTASPPSSARRDRARAISPRSGRSERAPGSIGARARTRRRAAARDRCAGAGGPASRAGVDEAALFHLLNLAKEEDCYVLLTAARRLDSGFALADLASRLRAVPVAALGAARRRAARRRAGQALRRPPARRGRGGGRAISCRAWNARWRRPAPSSPGSIAAALSRGRAVTAPIGCRIGR